MPSGGAGPPGLCPEAALFPPGAPPPALAVRGTMLKASLIGRLRALPFTESVTCCGDTDRIWKFCHDSPSETYVPCFVERLSIRAMVCPLRVTEPAYKA